LLAAKKYGSILPFLTLVVAVKLFKYFSKTKKLLRKLNKHYLKQNLKKPIKETLFCKKI